MRSVLSLVLLLWFLTLGAFSAESSGLLDQCPLGDEAAEQAHGFSSEQSEAMKGPSGETARRLLPLTPVDWQGGKVAFTMKVDPVQPTYFTVRLWGSDLSTDRLILFCEGKQIGYRHLGDIDILDSPNGSPAFRDRFFYPTTPLPLALTRGKTELHFEIRSTGPIWSYAKDWKTYQKPMKQPTRGIYRVYTHTDGFFQPPPAQGAAPLDPPTRADAGPEVLEALKTRVNETVRHLLKQKRPLTQMEVWFLARAARVGWTAAYANPAVVQKTVETLDRLYVAYHGNPKIAQAEPSIYNADWFGLGPAGQCVALLAEPLRPLLEAEITGAPGVTRRAGWAEMLVTCRDSHRANRRLYTNQSMINDTYGIYLANRGVAILAPAQALPEPAARRYLYESAGIEPWLGSEQDGEAQKRLGETYLQLTRQGLTKELGFVGYYGEVLDWMTGMWEATRLLPGEKGDDKLKAQLVKVARARAVFRTPALDDEGHRAMRAEAVIGWRDQDHYPGDVTYQERQTWDASTIASAAATLDPALVSYAQQMLADGQLFSGLREFMKKENGLRVTAGLLAVPEDYEKLIKQPPSRQQLPMTPGQPDFVWADEEDGVVAVKHGEEILYASLYWRARTAINFLARVHFTTPQIDRLAVVRQEEVFEPSGLEFKRPDWINMAFANGGFRYPVELHSAHAGEKLPIAKVPPGLAYKPGAENPYAGRAAFYRLQYGNYLIGMNATDQRTFTLAVPAGISAATDLSSGKKVPLTSALTIPPGTTVVLYLQR